MKTSEKWKASEMGIISDELQSHGNYYICGLIDPDDEKQKANARLIAAAPDMLEALEEANRILGIARQYFPDSIRNADTFSLINAQENSIRKAIRKAKGE